MRIEIAGAQVTESVVDVLETLQTETELVRSYVETIDELTRTVILDLTAVDEGEDSRTLERIRFLQMIRRDILRLANPPDVNDPKNDIPTACF